MRIPLTEIEPVAIALDRIDVEGDVRFTGVDLESGARVTVHIERRPQGDEIPVSPTREAHDLPLIFSSTRS